METAMLVAAIDAAAAIAAASGVVVRPLPPQPLPPPVAIASLPMAAAMRWPVRRCGDGVPGRDETSAATAIDPACRRLTVSDRPVGQPGLAHAAASRADPDGAGWRVARAVLPGLGGLVGPGGFGLGLGGELPLVRGARPSLHLAAARDTRIAATQFAPETTVQARCGACWEESEALGAGLADGRRSRAAAAAAR